MGEGCRRQCHLDRCPIGGRIERAGLGPAAKHVQMLGADRPVLPTVPLFVRSVPIDKALHADTMLATQMNGEPLPFLHGAPLRLIVPGWAGDACVKWLTHLNVQELEAEGYYMKTAYRMPAKPVKPGSPGQAVETVPVEAMPVKSIIARPDDGARVTVGDIPIQGVAWTGEGEVVRVEVSTDNEKTWHEAELIGEQRPMPGVFGSMSGEKPDPANVLSSRVPPTAEGLPSR